ncbi:MAG: hypothetical protein Q9180_001789 [Flavoplaca navasiana]
MEERTDFPFRGRAATRSNRGLVGRPKGPQPKRKAAAELSTNPNTVKSRKRFDKFSTDEKAVDMAKRNDRRAVAYKIKKLEGEDEYIAASLEKKKAMVAAVKEQSFMQRVNQGKAASIIARQVGVALNAANLPVWDDGSLAFEDIPEEECADDDDYMAVVEQIARLDMSTEDRKNPVPTESNAALYRRARQSPLKLKATTTILYAATIRKSWRKVIRSFFAKLRHLDGCVLPCRHTAFKHDKYRPGTKVPTLPPHKYFSSRQKALFRNLWAWTTRVDEEGWYDLPGPAEWWSGYPFDHSGVHNWEPDADSRLARRAWQIIREEFDFSFVPDLLRIAPTEEELTIMKPGLMMI